MNGVENNLVPNKTLSVGVIPAPNELRKPVLYSHKEGAIKSQMLMNDIYEKERANNFDNKRKTPISVFVALGIAAIGAGWITFKKALKW